MIQGRRCFRCNSDKTWEDKDGYPCWIETECSFLCNACYCRQRRLEGHRPVKPVNLMLCACGCLGLLLNRGINGQPHKYIKGHYNRGRRPPRSAIEKISGDKNHGWKADNVGYCAVHEYVVKRREKPELCEICHKVSPYDLAFLLHPKKHTRNPDNYRWLCRSCHLKLDYDNGIREPTSIPKDLRQTCSRCDSSHIIKAGFLYDKQRFKCINCQKSWSMSMTDLILTFCTKIGQGEMYMQWSEEGSHKNTVETIHGLEPIEELS